MGEHLQKSGGGQPNDMSGINRLRSEQIRMLYGSGSIGVAAAGVGALLLASIVYYQDVGPVSAVRIWLLLVAADVALHLSLAHIYRRAHIPADQWKRWAFGFCVFSLFEGLIWGMTSVYLTVPDALTQQLLIMLVVCAVTSGATSAFAIYLPAFYAIFFPATIPFVVLLALHGDLLHYGIVALAMVFIAGMIFVARQHNANLIETLRLRFENQDLSENLRIQKEAAEEATLAKSRFLASASHDLRQPVHALSLFIGAMQSAEMDVTAREILTHMTASVEAIDGLFNSLLDISRLDAGAVRPVPVTFPIQPVLTRIYNDHATEARKKGLRLISHPSTAMVHTDPILLERILRNLVSNAVRYTDRGRVVIGCRRGRSLSIQIWDTGRGIPRDQQGLVFLEFYQIGNPERDRTKGLGLGLAIVKRLTVLLDCPLSFVSEPGKGSVFKVAVPLAHDLQVETSVDTPDQPEERSREGLVLVIDDEIPIQQATRKLLQGWGYDVVVAGTYGDMRDAIERNSALPVLIICDYRLPDNESGIEAIGRLRTHYGAEIPAVLITGDTAARQIRDIQDSDLLVLHKPVPIGKLRATVFNLTRSMAEE